MATQEKKEFLEDVLQNTGLDVHNFERLYNEYKKTCKKLRVEPKRILRRSPSPPNPIQVKNKPTYGETGMNLKEKKVVRYGLGFSGETRIDPKCGGLNEIFVKASANPASGGSDLVLGGSLQNEKPSANPALLLGASTSNGSSQPSDSGSLQNEKPSANPALGASTSNGSSQPSDSGSLQNDYVYDESSGYYYNSGTGYYYDPSSGLYCSAFGQWYIYNEERMAWEEAPLGDYPDYTAPALGGTEWTNQLSEAQWNNEVVTAPISAVPATWTADAAPAGDGWDVAAEPPMAAAPGIVIIPPGVPAPSWEEQEHGDNIQVQEDDGAEHGNVQEEGNNNEADQEQGNNNEADQEDGAAADVNNDVDGM